MFLRSHAKKLIVQLKLTVLMDWTRYSAEPVPFQRLASSRVLIGYPAEYCVFQKRNILCVKHVNSSGLFIHISVMNIDKTADNA